MKSKAKIILFAVLVGAVSVLSSCGFYSFSGTSIPIDVKTFSVAFFENNASINSPLLSQTLTEGLKQKFISETNLNITEKEGDFEFSGEITDFTVSPASAQSSDNATLNRLTIVTNVKLVCKIDPKLSFEQSFSNFQDFDAMQDFNTVENELADEISDMLIQSIFNKAAINW